MYIVASITAILLVHETKGHANDICSIGRDGSNTLINGNWTYQGIDEYSKRFWYSECHDAKLIWGQQYNLNYNFYIITPQDATGLYSYCSLDDTDPENCDSSWYVYDPDNGWQIDADFVVQLCSYYTQQSSCINSTYLNSLNIDPTTGYCIDNAQYQPQLNGNWEYQGCDDGLPYFQLQLQDSNINSSSNSSSDEKYIYYNWCYSYWLVGSDITSLTVNGYCATWDFIDCNNNLYQYDTNSGSFQLDTIVEIEHCTPAPTESPSTPPTQFPTHPSLFPTQSPSNSPTDPSSVPTASPTYPTLFPTSIPTATPTETTLSPTLLPTSVPTPIPTTIPTTLPTTLPTHMPTLSTTTLTTLTTADHDTTIATSTSIGNEQDSTSTTPENTDDFGNNQQSSNTNLFNDLTGSMLSSCCVACFICFAFFWYKKEIFFYLCAFCLMNDDT